MTQINNKFKVKQGLEVTGDAVLLNNLTVVGDVHVPTVAQTDNSDKAASTAYVKQAVSDIVSSAPGTLDTLNELAAALGDDPNFATTMTNNLASKAPLDSAALIGTPTAPTAADATNTDQIATTKFVQSQKNSTALTGTPTAPTAPVDTNTTQLATTAFVIGQASTANPLMDGVAANGVSTLWARQDHVHPSDTSKANLSGAAFTGAVSVAGAFTASSDVKLAANSFVRNPTDNLYLQTDTAGKDIIFRTAGNTERARIKDAGRVLIGTAVDNGADLLQVNGPVSATTFKGGAALTGTPTAPTAAAGTNSTQIATTAYVDTGLGLKANASNPTFTGDTAFSGGVGSSDYVVIPMPGGAEFVNNANVTGAIKVSLPVLYTSNMVQFTVSVYEHNTNASFDLVLSGYIQNSTSSWVNTSAYMVGGDSSRIPNVRFGNDGTHCCVWLGETTDTWAFPQVTVRDVKVGYGSSSASWMSGWSIGGITVFDTVKIGPVVPLKAANIASPTFTGIPRAPTAAAGNNSTQIATTAYVDAADSLKAPLASPALTGTPTAPTAVAGTNTTQIATTQFVGTALSNLVNAAPGTLDTLKELADAIGDDPNFATTMTNNLAAKAPLASPALTGTPTAPTAPVDTNTTQLATTAYVVGQGYAKVADGYAKLASPSFSGIPITPTASNGTNNNQIASTQFVQSAINSVLTKSVAGGVDVNISATEATNRVLILTGALTANTSVIFPTAAGIWTIVNNTTGAYTLTVKMAAGTSVAVAQNYADIVVSDAANMFQAVTDFTNAYLGGAPTATTAAVADNSNRIATTAYVQSQGYISNTATIDGGTF